MRCYAMRPSPIKRGGNLYRNIRKPADGVSSTRQHKKKESEGEDENEIWLLLGDENVRIKKSYCAEEEVTRTN